MPDFKLLLGGGGEEVDARLGEGETDVALDMPVRAVSGVRLPTPILRPPIPGAATELKNGVETGRGEPGCE